MFVAGLLLGDARLPYAGEIDRFTASLASLAEVAVFLALGLTIDLAGITVTDWLDGVALFLVMAVLVRPLVVVLTLARSALNRPEMAFIAWSGLKGAVPILLAAFAVLGHVPDHQRIYDVIFVVVLVSVVIQVGLVPVVAARLGIPMQVQPELPWELSVKLAEPPRDRVEHAVEAGSRADGGRLDDLPLGNRAWVTLVVRDAHAVPPRPDLDCTPAISYSCWASTMNPSLPTCSRKAGDRTLFSDETLEQALRQLRMHRSRQVVD